MNFYKNLAVIFLLIGFSQLPFQAQSNLAAKDIETIKNIEETFRAAWLKNDEKTILSLFTEDATLYPGSNAPVKGKDGLYKFWFAPSDTITIITAFELKIEDIGGDKNFASVSGADEISWTTEKKDKTEMKRCVSKGNFIAIYVKQNKKWKMWKRFGASKTEEIK